MLTYLSENRVLFMEALGTHLLLSVVSLGVAMIIGIPLGILSYYQSFLRKIVFLLANTLRVIPSIALLTLMIPIIGTGKVPAMIALTILAFPPIFIHTYLGMESVEDVYVISGESLGLTKWQLLRHVQWHFMRNIVLTGIVISAIEVIASATLASFIGGGGLGTFIVSGLSLYSYPILLVGAIPVALLAIIVEMMSRNVIKKWESVG